MVSARSHRRALVAATLASLAIVGPVYAAQTSDDFVELELDPREGVAFALTPSAGEQPAVATKLEWNGYDICVVVPPGAPRRVIAEPYEGRWSIEGADGRRRVVAVRVDEKDAPRGLSSLTPEEISQLWGILVDAWSPKIARLMAHVDPTRACVSISPELRAPPPLDGKLRYLTFTAPYRPISKKAIVQLSRYPELRYLQLTGFPPETYRIDASTIRAPRLEYLRLFGDVDHVDALGRLATLRKLDLRGIKRLGAPAFLGDLHALEGAVPLRRRGPAPRGRLARASAGQDRSRRRARSRAPARRHARPPAARHRLEPRADPASYAASPPLNPHCQIRHRFNEILQDLFRDASLVRISWRLRGKLVESTSEERDPAKIAALASKLVVAETTSRVICGCMPDAWLDVMTPRGTSRLYFNCGTALQTEELPGDGNLTPSSVTALEQWLEHHGVDLANCDGCTAHDRRRTR